MKLAKACLMMRDRLKEIGEDEDVEVVAAKQARNTLEEIDKMLEDE